MCSYLEGQVLRFVMTHNVLFCFVFLEIRCSNISQTSLEILGSDYPSSIASWLVRNTVMCHRAQMIILKLWFLSFSQPNWVYYRLTYCSHGAVSFPLIIYHNNISCVLGEPCGRNYSHSTANKLAPFRESFCISAFHALRLYKNITAPALVWKKSSCISEGHSCFKNRNQHGNGGPLYPRCASPRKLSRSSTLQVGWSENNWGPLVLVLQHMA